MWKFKGKWRPKRTLLVVEDKPVIVLFATALRKLYTTHFLLHQRVGVYLQHVLSGAFENILHVETGGISGTETVTIHAQPIVGEDAPRLGALACRIGRTLR